MKTERNILTAFLLNLFFAVFEFLGGTFTGSVAIVSDAVHDLADAMSIGLSWLLEKKSQRKPDENCTFGYGRYSVLGSFLTTAILLAGSGAVIWQSVRRLLHPAAIHYDGMILMAVVGVSVNFLAAYFTREGDSLNQKAVNLHMLEDVLGWVVVLVGAVVMRFTDFSRLDPLLSMGVSCWIIVHCVKNLKDIGRVFLEKAPEGCDAARIRGTLAAIQGVEQVRQLHLWTLDGQERYAAVKAVTAEDFGKIRKAIHQTLAGFGIQNVTVELTHPGEE